MSAKRKQQQQTNKQITYIKYADLCVVVQSRNEKKKIRYDEFLFVFVYLFRITLMVQIHSGRAALARSLCGLEQLKKIYLFFFRCFTVNS